MKKVFTLFFILCFYFSRSQDVGVTDITAPVSGCSLTATENVTIKIFNFGATNLSATTFTVSYVINAGVPVSESVSFPSFLPGTTVTYTFITKANLFAFGSYTFDASTNLTGDINPANDAMTGYVVNNNSPSIGGSISGDGGVCVSGNSGTLTLGGHTGSVLDWQYTTDGGTTWFTISNTTINQNYNNVTILTSYRVRVQNASCAAALSDTADLTIDPVTVPGSVTANATVCSGTNSGTLTLAGHTGSITRWEFSIDGGTIWTPIANVTTTESYTNLTTTTRYRAVVKSGSCASANSAQAIITVNPVAVGGTVNTSAAVCSGSNSGTLTLSGHTATVVRWEFSTNGGTSWTNIANTTTSQGYTNLTTTTLYRALVQSSPCVATAYSVAATITVNPSSVGGTVTTSTVVCTGANSGTLTLAGNSGSVLRWEFSINGGTSWTNIVNTTTSQGYTNLTTTTLYRALSQQGTCASAYSTTATITVSPASVGGTTSPASATVCNGANSGTITLAGNVGSVVRWEFSINGGISWTNIANTTTSQAYTNLTTATQYRAFVQSGACSGLYSTVSSLTISPTTVGGSIASSATVCTGSNGGTLTLGGYTGTILRWEFSTNGGSTWTTIANTSTTQNYLNLTTTTLYRSVIQSGVCPSANSVAATITVNALTVGGTASPASLTVCNGVNSGNVTLAGHTGSVLRWEYSTDGGVSWTNIANTTITQGYTNLTTATQYRAYVQNGVCSALYSSVSSLSIDPNTVAGTVASSTSVCTGTNSGTLTLSGHTGSIVRWESSIDGGTTWTSIANTTTTQSYTNLTTTTYYRTVVKSGVCASSNTAAVIIQVDPLTVAGTTSGPAVVCASSNSGTITLSGNTGSVLNWESSTDGGVTWTSIANTSLTQSYLNITATTQYRAVVQSGVCSSAPSTSTTITVDAVTLGGTIASSAMVCSGSNNGTLTLGGNNGNVIRWEYSIDGGSTWLLTTNTSSTQSYNNITQNTMYRVEVKNGVCASAYSASASITVTPVSNAGTLASSASVCSSTNAGTITLTGYTGGILNWESSTDGGVTWTPIASTSASQSYTNLTVTTMYRSLVQSGVCASDTSNTVTITVDATTAGGIVTPVDTVCSGLNNGTVTLSGNTGSIMGWEFSTNNGVSWMSITNTTASQNYGNLTQTTLYRALIKSGSCPSQYSIPDTIKVDAVTNPGTLASSAAVCSSANAGTINLTGYTGSILNWESSTDGGLTWTTIASTSASQSYTNLTATTQYRSLVKSGVCASDTSNAVTITVDAATAGGFAAPVDTVCSGVNNGTITLSGHTGTVSGWEFSNDNGASWFAVTNTSTSQNYTNLTKTTLYRAVVKNGTCPSAYSSADTIKVDPVTNAGVLASAATVCSGSNSGAVTVSGSTGNILNWESSTDGGLTWTPIASTSATQTYTNLTSTTDYRVIIKSGVCANDTSNVVKISVDSVSAGGVTASPDTVCSGSNNGMITLAGHKGNVSGWEFSTDNGASWMSLSNTTITQNYVNLIQTTLYRAVVKNGVCPSAYSLNDTITVDPVSNAGIITGTASACEGSNAGTITLNGYTGSVSGWESSVDGGLTWLPIANTTGSENYNNLSVTTQYWAIVKSGVCSADTSAIVTITIFPKPQANFVANNACVGSPITFSNFSTIASGGIQINNWDFGDGNVSFSQNPAHIYVAAGTYSVTLITISNNNCSDTAMMIVSVSPLPNATIFPNGPTNVCSGDSVILFAPSGTDLKYQWNTGDTTVSIIVDSSGVYSVIVTDTITGCFASDSISVTIFPAALVSAGKDTTLKRGATLVLNGSGAVSYLWTPSVNMSNPLVSNPTVTPTATTVYTLIATDVNGCNAVDSVKVTVSDEYDLEIANILTPNGDGFNDTWKIRNIELFTDNEVSIFNRFGQEVYQTGSYKNDWDGNNLPDGTYYYALKFNDTGKVFKGAMTILRDK